MSSSGNASHRTSSSSTGRAASLNNFQFDFGLGPSAASSRPLKDQKPSTTSSAAPIWTSQPTSKPSWTHQPSASSSGVGGVAASRPGLAAPPASMVGDILGKSWASSAPPPSRLGIPETNPNLFSDLVGSALGQGRSSNVPLKAAAPKSSFSMNKLSDSLPKSTPAPAAQSTNPIKSGGWGSSDQFGSFASSNSINKMGGFSSAGVQQMKPAPSAPLNAKKDPFGSLMDFGAKPASMAPANSSKVCTGGAGDHSFGAFQNANFPKEDGFGIPAQSFSSPPPAPPSAAKTTNSQQPSQSTSSDDPLGMFFSSSASAAPAGAPASSEMFSEMNDWDIGSEFNENDGGATTELEGLPPPPAGVTASAAKTKGTDSYKQGQFADAIKWLSWAVVLLGKSGDNDAATEVLSCRAFCYKEVGEYKKAVADCSKVLEHDRKNVVVLLQRALLYESTEKYKLGADDLRMVLKIDPTNRLAKSTIHRLNKMAG